MIYIERDGNLEELQYWIWFSKITNSKEKYKIFNEYKSPKKIYELSNAQIENLEYGQAIKKELKNSKYRENLKKEEQILKDKKIYLLTRNNKYYPQRLCNIYDAPISLYAKGNIEILNKKTLAMIGCRENSYYGKQVALTFSYQLSKKGINIISGLAKGIDSYSHIGAIKAKASTIAVIGSGLDNFYPKENQWLYDEILKNNGCIISEYPLETKPNKINFPARNRIISGMSEGVIVVEAKRKSGTMITVDFALEQGKEVFVVPGNITSKNSEGTNSLIQEGAKLVTNIEEIII